MARVAYKASWFEELASTSLYETEFEAVVERHADTFFPNYLLVPFKCVVCSEDDSAKPDMALVHKDYREWWVVEIEMGHHPFESHVLHQVRVLSGATYGEAEGVALWEACPSLDRQRVLDMLKGKQPRVLVVVNKYRREWAQPLKRYDAELAVIEMFRSDRNEHMFLVDGFIPSAPVLPVSDCAFDPVLPRFLVVESPSILQVAVGQRLTITYDGCPSEWQRIDAADRVWLAPMGKNPLSTAQRYRLLKMGDGSFGFEDK